MHSFLLLASLFKRASEPYEFAFAAILFVFHQSQDLVPRSSHSLSWPPFWINFHPPWTNRSRDFCCVPGYSPDDPPFWNHRGEGPGDEVVKGPFKYLNDGFPYPLIYHNLWNRYPFIYLKPFKGTPFRRCLPVEAIIGSTLPHGVCLSVWLSDWVTEWLN